MKKLKLLIIILFSVIFGFIYIQIGISKPKKFFNEKEVKQVFLQFKEGSNSALVTKQNVIYLSITKPSEVSLIKNYITELTLDLTARHRPSEFSVYMNFQKLKKNKWEIKMSRIDGENVFFFDNGLYKNDSLAKYIYDKLEIVSKKN
jgi:hypothetical protein